AEGLHAGLDILNGLDARFDRQALGFGPYYFPDLAGTSEADEQAAIDGALIKANRIQYAGRRGNPRHSTTDVTAHLRALVLAAARADLIAGTGGGPENCRYLVDGVELSRGDAGHQVIGGVITWVAATCLPFTASAGGVSLWR